MLNANFVTMLLLTLGTISSSAQQHAYPEIGKLCPPFNFAGKSNVEGASVSLTSVKGRYTILDFWSKTCMACMSSMPKLNNMQKKHKDKLDIVLVGYQDPEGEIEPLYNRLQDRNKLELIAVFDSATFRRFVPESVPHLVWINNKGIVMAITETADLTEANIMDFVRDIPFEFHNVSYKSLSAARETKLYDRKRPFLINGNGGNDTAFVFRSVLAKWKEGMAVSPNGRIDASIRGDRPKFETLKTPLLSLYKIAYFGSTAPEEEGLSGVPILEMKNTSLFEYEKGGSARGLYCYSLIVPPGNAGKMNLMRMMQNDLNSYFGYYARVEVRNLQCYALVVINTQDLLKAKKHPKYTKSTWQHNQGGILYDMPVKKIVKILTYDLPDGPLVFDETALKENLTLDLSGVLTSDLKDLRRGLQVYGLDLIPSVKPLKVLVIGEKE